MVEEQCSFRKGRSYTDPIFTVQQIIEKRKVHNLPLFLLYIGYEKAYDNVNRDKLWEMVDNKIRNYLLNTIKCIYRNTKVRIKFNDGISEPIYINKGVRQGCGLPPVLSSIYINKIIQENSIRQRFSNCGPRTTRGPRVLPLWSFQIEHQSKKDRKNKINVNCVSHTVAENLKQSLEITYNKRL